MIFFFPTPALPGLTMAAAVVLSPSVVPTVVLAHLPQGGPWAACLLANSLHGDSGMEFEEESHREEFVYVTDITGHWAA